MILVIKEAPNKLAVAGLTREQLALVMSAINIALPKYPDRTRAILNEVYSALAEAEKEFGLYFGANL